MNAPENIERLTPQEAWEDGYRAGREELARKMEADKAAHDVLVVLDQAKERDTRVRLLQERLMRIETELGDHATVVVGLGRRVARLEEGG